MRNKWRTFASALLLLAGIACIVGGCRQGNSARQGNPTFDGEKAYEHVVAQCALGPRPVGSEENRQTAEYISDVLQKLGWVVEMQEFTYRGVLVRNVVASQGTGPLVILGAHYDTRSVADHDPLDPTQPVLGGNDGASGVGVLLELARTLDLEDGSVELWLAFFDAEDQGGINGWPFSVGAAYLAQHLSARPKAVVVVDMIGDQDQRFLWEANSDSSLQRALWSIAADLGYEDHFVPRDGYAIIDDHLPFIQQGLVAVDIIDFEYPYWHTAEDTPDKVSPESLQRVGRVLEAWLETNWPE